MVRLYRWLVPALAVLALFAAFASPTFAAEKSRTVTEEQINSRSWVTTPRARAVSNRKVDLQPGQVVISETWTVRTVAKAVSVTLTPTVSDGRVEWNLASATVDGQPASAELQQQIQSRIANSWARFVKNQAKPGRTTAVMVTDADITYTFATKS